jgi:hypothetical protein
VMGLFERKIRPAFVDAPAEPPVPTEVRIAGIDKRLIEAAEMRPWDSDTRAEMNWLLDQRNKIRPGRPLPVPVVPGRIDSIIDNYGENPW